MSDTVAEFVAQNGYGPFFLLALPMIAVLVLSQGGEAAAKVMALVLVAVMFLMGILLKDFSLGFVNTALMPREYADGSGNYLPAKLRVSPKPDPWFPWGIASPLSLAFTFAILLPARQRILPILLCAGLLFYGQYREADEDGIVAEGALTYVRAEARELADEVEVLIDWARDQFGARDDS